MSVDPRRRLTNNVAISPVPPRPPAAAGRVCMSRCWPSCMPPACWTGRGSTARPGPEGRLKTGPSPVDRARTGSKHHSRTPRGPDAIRSGAVPAPGPAGAAALAGLLVRPGSNAAPTTNDPLGARPMEVGMTSGQGASCVARHSRRTPRPTSSTRPTARCWGASSQASERRPRSSARKERPGLSALGRKRQNVYCPSTPRRLDRPEQGRGTVQRPPGRAGGTGPWIRRLPELYQPSAGTVGRARLAAGGSGHFAWVVGADRTDQAGVLYAHGADTVDRDLRNLAGTPDRRHR
jgi:hypothetical protein